MSVSKDQAMGIVSTYMRAMVKGEPSTHGLMKEVWKKGTLFLEKQPNPPLGFEPEKQQCYFNSMQLASQDRSYAYYQGFMFQHKLEPFGLSHAFNVKDGLMIDTTPLNEIDIWFGIEVPFEVVLESAFNLSALTPLEYYHRHYRLDPDRVTQIHYRGKGT